MRRLPTGAQDTILPHRAGSKAPFARARTINVRMPFLSGTQRALPRAVSQLVYCNPFLTERVEFERAALGAEFVEGEPVWSYRVEHPGPRENHWRIQGRLEPVAEQVRARLLEGVEAREPDLVLYEDAVLSRSEER